MPWYEWHGDDLILNLLVQPRSSKEGFAEIMGESIKLRTTAPPVNGKANSQIINYLSKAFGVSKKAVQIEKGLRGRHKRIRIKKPSRTPLSCIQWE